MDNLEALYCHIDDYCKAYTAEQQKKMLTLKRKSSKKTRNKPCCISLAEIITILVLFHQIRYREFKAFYYGYLCQWLKSAFPRLPSYNRMVELMEKAVHPMCDYLKFLMQGNCTGHRDKLHWLNQSSCVWQPPYQTPQSLCRHCRTRQKQHGLVLWL